MARGDIEKGVPKPLAPLKSKGVKCGVATKPSLVGFGGSQRIRNQHMKGY